MDWSRPQVPSGGFDHSQLPERYALGLIAVAAAQTEERARGAEPRAGDYRTSPPAAAWRDEGQRRVLTIPDVVEFVPSFDDPTTGAASPIGCLVLLAGLLVASLGALAIGRWPGAPFLVVGGALAVVVGLFLARASRARAAKQPLPIRRTGLYLFPDGLLYVRRLDTCFFLPKRLVGRVARSASGRLCTWIYYPDEQGYPVALYGSSGDVVALVERWKAMT